MDEKLTRQILDDLAEIVAIKSVYSEPEEGAPYGKGCLEALEWFVNKARGYGLRAELLDGYAAYAEVGEGDECVGILGHLDVVPAGNGWATDPFKMTEENGKVYGRGVGDDKGAVVVCLAALKTLKDNATKLKRRVRLIVGADEERGSSCIRHYLKTGGEVPVASFVPDSEFPLINAEKGIAHIELRCDASFLAGSIAHISGAECANAVPDKATVDIIIGSPLYDRLSELCGGAITADLFKLPLIAKRIIEIGSRITDYEVCNGKYLTITAHGVAEHASTPDKGDNALWKILGVLALFEDELKAYYLENIYQYLCTRECCKKIGVYVDDPKSGDTTVCMSQADIKDGKLTLLFDFRLPLGVSPIDVASNMEKHFDSYVSVGAYVRDWHKNLYIPTDAPLIKKLLKVYRDITGDMTEPLHVGGGTYARELPNAVAFGCTPLGMDINMHRADENFPIAQLFKNYEIYSAAAIELANM